MSITEQVNSIQQLIRTTEISCQRPPGTVHLLGVSKGRTAEEIEQAYTAGLSDFGESYLQEALSKIQALATLPLCWHFIGPIQSNKTNPIANHFAWVHSVSRHKIALQLNDARPKTLPPLNICIQVNLDDEETKAGIKPNDLAELAYYVLQLPRLHLRGLMAIPKRQLDEQQQYLSFIRLNQLLHTLNQQLNICMDTLSMGMSGDIKAAIRAGSTMVRVGTAIFGGNTREN